MPPPLPFVAEFPVIVTLERVTRSGFPVFIQIPPPFLRLVIFAVPALLLLMMVPWSISVFAVMLRPPPKPAAWFPEIVLEWITVCLEPVELEVMVIPPPDPALGDPLLVARLLSTWLLLIDIRDGSETQMPPPVPVAPPVTCFAELFWMMLLLIVARPVPLLVLKIAMPAPLPSLVAQFCSVTLVRVRLAVAVAGVVPPVSNSMHPPSPSVPATDP